MSGNQNRSSGGWEVQEGSEISWVGAGISGALRESIYHGCTSSQAFPVTLGV